MSDSESEEPEEQAADADAEADAAEDTEEATGLADGDFVELEYTARTVEDGTLVDTTDPEVAAEEGVDDEERTFEPRTVVIGAGHLFEPVEDDLLGKAVGDGGTVTVPATEAFGEYDDEEVRTVSADKIDEDDRYPGAHVQVDGQEGHLETIIGGRARVDFNHPLAGEDIEYDYEIADVIEGREEQAVALLATYLDMELDVDIEVDEVEELQPVESDDDGDDGDEDDEPTDPEYEEVTVEKETLYIESTPQLSFNQQWMFQKQQIAQELMDRVDVDRVIIQEIIDGGGMGPMGGMGGMMPGMGGGDVEDALEDADIDADELAEELDAEE